MTDFEIRNAEVGKIGEWAENSEVGIRNVEVGKGTWESRSREKKRKYLINFTTNSLNSKIRICFALRHEPYAVRR